MKFDLYRYHCDDEGTLGVLLHAGRIVCQMGELPWRDNRANLSCIPVGEYQVNYLPRSGSGRYRDVYHVVGVEGRAGILIHPGNLTGDRTKGLKTHSWGCLLPGSRLGRLRGQRAVLASRSALADLHLVTSRNGFTLVVHDD